MLQTPRADVTDFGSALHAAGSLLLVGGRIGIRKPYTALYRVDRAAAVREATTHGASDHDGPLLATDGQRIVVAQPCEAASRPGFAHVYLREGRSIELEATLRPAESERTKAGFARSAAIHGELLALGHSASIAIYRHSPVGWLSTAAPLPTLPYGFNPQLGRALAVVGDHVFVGNPVEIDGHRAGPGRVLVYRHRAGRSELTHELASDGIEFGRAQPYELGFGASIHAAGGLVAIAAPVELSREGRRRARVYVYRMELGGLSRVAALTVPNCQHGVCLTHDKLLVLGDRLYVYARRADGFREVASYARHGAEAIASCGPMVALAHPRVDRVSLHFAAQL